MGKQGEDRMYNTDMGMKSKALFQKTVMFTLVCISSLLSLGSVPLPDDEDAPRTPPPGPVQLLVEPLQQKKITSCGEAAITMAYNYGHTDSPLNELDIVAFAMDKGYYIDDRRPYTSPTNMILIAKNFAKDINAGKVSTSDEGLTLLFERLSKDEPVIIDIWTYLDIPYSDAHFVVVTGISAHPKNQGIYIIHYNNPLTARAESARWDVIWNAWQNNGDPGGSGWWMTIPSPE
jgi:hypothetical protein